MIDIWMYFIETRQVGLVQDKQCNQERTNFKRDLLQQRLGALNKRLKTQASEISP